MPNADTIARTQLRLVNNLFLTISALAETPHRRYDDDSLEATLDAVNTVETAARNYKAAVRAYVDDARDLRREMAD